MRANPTASIDRGIAEAVARLNLIPGATTRASCQGRSAAEHGTHAELAYVLFEEPLPLTLEDHLLDVLGDIARIEPDGLYCRWPERNAELCERLAAALLRHPPAAGDGWHAATVTIATLDRLIGRRISGECRKALVWCRACDTLGDPARHASHSGVAVVVDYDGERTIAAIDEFLDRHPRPLDARLREREGAVRLLQRVRRGDFGAAYRADWRRALLAEATRVRRGDLRRVVRGLRSPELATDVYTAGGNVVFAHRLDRPVVGA